MKNSIVQIAGILVIGFFLGGGKSYAGSVNPFAHPTASSSQIEHLQLARVSIERAIKKAKAKYGGKVLSAKEIQSKGPLVYKIKLLLPNGRVKTVFVDGNSGEVFEG